jgi:Tol biopolymer transport system component
MMGSKNIIILLLLYSISTPAQKKNLIYYPDQKLPGMVAQVFARGIVSTDALEHSPPAFSPDGKTLFWTIMKMPTYQMRLLEMNFADNKWSPAHTPSFSDTTINELYPDFSPGGDTLFFSSNRKTGISSPQTNTLWFVCKTSDGWSEAKPLDTTLFKKDVYASSIAKNGNRYFIIGPNGTADWNIYKASPSGEIVSLPPHINSKGYEDVPFVAPDESYLIFESDRTGIKNNIDLYISFRKKDGSWAEPLNMGAKINSAFVERFAKLSPDGIYLFFGRNTGSGFDIYWISAAIIDELKNRWLKTDHQRISK